MNPHLLCSSIPIRLLAFLFVFAINIHKLDAQNTLTIPQIETELLRAESFLVSFKNDSAKEIVENLLLQFESEESRKSPLGIRVQLAQATALERDEKDSAAIKKLLYVRDLSQEEEQWNLYVKACLVLANLYEKIDRSDACLQQLRLAENGIKKYGLIECYPNYTIRMSSWQRIFGQKDSAIYYAREALATAPKIGLVLEEAIGHMLMGMLMKDSSAYLSVQHYFSGLRLYKKLEDYTGCSYMFSGIAHYYHQSGKPQLALAYTDSMIAIAEKAVALGNESHHSLPGTYRFRGRLFRELGQQDSAWHYLEKGYEMSLSLMKQSNADKVIEIDARYRDEKKAQQLEEQFLQIELDKVRRNGLIIFSVVAFLFLIVLGYYYLNLRQANRKAQEQANSLQQLADARSRFFANISHELRTPLTLILGPLSVILDQQRTWDKALVKKQLSMIRRNGLSLMKLVEEILDISRLDEDKLKLNMEKIALMPFIESVFSTFIPQFSYQNITYTLNLGFSKDLWIAVDPGKLEKVLNNFLSNAMKHTPIGGNIGLSINDVGDGLELKVSDTGRGIHPQDLPFIFDRFYQSQQEGFQINGGTGIGLSLVKEIAQLMGGKVSVESSLGKGSTFTFLMSKKEVLPGKPVVSASGPVVHQSVAKVETVCSILIVEDNFDMREFIRELLEPKYQKIIVARNGVEALEILHKENHKIDLIISDMMMPEMDGLTMINSIRTNPDWEKIPVIMLTALSREKDRIAAIRTGVDDYLTKPFSATELLARVDVLIFNYYKRRISIEEEKDEGSSSQISSFNQDWVNSLEETIQNSLKNGVLTVELLAESVHLSTRQLNRKLKSLTGMAPHKFIREVQLQSARQKLEEGRGSSLLDVALRSGFEHQGTFSTLFKSRFGKSPGEYLKTHFRES